ncbi:NAD(P)H-hydrate epimerase [Thalassoglobus polymorphus]|uniref:NAD(P)H-hydrate epimerase n=1 Tax=Thalassoglobus polymorphus TaxID=2527994 RepID=A0A517QJ11_9PLAN|nr:NAD(P)H-hydrate epimerase [Thalassoglobus polymorphus]QDT31643.1 Bifunctional NAD(P)H-hydrate repair enzyme Nnr [Thalassoglobus polymorphus]
MGSTVLTRSQARAVDDIAIREYGIPGIVLMENAGRGIAELLLKESPTGRVTVLCGPGNNGGDGFVIARHLAIAGLEVMVIICTDPKNYHGDAATNSQIIQKAGLPVLQLSMPENLDRLISELQNSDWIVDAMLGSGTQGAIREPYLTIINAVNGIGKPVLAVDVPSGVDCDQGPTPDATIQARITATLVAAKPGLLTLEAEEYVGRLEVLGIGLPNIILTQILKS